MGMLERYDAEPHKCMACAAVVKKQRAYENQPHDDEGIHWLVINRDKE